MGQFARVGPPLFDGVAKCLARFGRERGFG